MANKQGKTYECPDMADFIGRTLRALVRRAGEGDREALSALARVSSEAETALEDAVHAIREKGNSWTDVARELGMTRQAAHKRWGRRPPPACRLAEGVAVEHVGCYMSGHCTLYGAGHQPAPC